MRNPEKRAARRRARGSFLLGVFVGLALGLGIALGVAFYLNKTPIPFLSKPKTDAAKPPAISGLPSPAATSAAAKGGEKPKFDFYRILPGGEEPVSETDLKQAARSASKGQPDSPKDVYYIQAGSFQNPADADNQKARLAILGVESSVEPTVLPDKGTHYRVRLGPFAKLDELNRVRQTLAQNGIDAALVKLKPN